MDSPPSLIRRLRLAAGLSQRGLAGAGATSQPAIARYESGAATPSWETMQRLAAACGRRLTLGEEPLIDDDDIELVERMLLLTPAQRLAALRRYAHLHDVALRGRQ